MNTPCPICDDTGWKPIPATLDRPAAHVIRCDCKVANRAERLLAQARIPRRYEHCTLENYSTDFAGAPQSISSARLAAGRFVEDYPALTEGKGLLFFGGIGVGKTHLAAGTIRELTLQKGAQCLFYDYRELLKEIQNSYNPSVSTTELEILRPVFDAEVLALDELGAVKPTEWVWDTVSHILNTRYNDKRTTIITTNFPNLPAVMAQSDEPEDRTVARKLAGRATREETLGDRIGERMRSRLHEMCLAIEITGSDFRQRVKGASIR